MIRIIPKLEVKGPNLIKGIHLEGLRIVGEPHKSAVKYYKEGADELIYIDLVASLYQRKYLLDIISRTADEVFIPLTVGGGVKTIEDMRTLFKVGADKIAINTGIVENPNLISQAANIFGSQCIVASIEVQKLTNDTWEPYTDCGRNPTGLNALTWAMEVAKLGAGEILLTSINQDGTKNGFDIEFTKLVSTKVPIPVISSGGAGNLKHCEDAITFGHADGLALASILHFKTLSIKKIKSYLLKKKLPIRPIN